MDYCVELAEAHAVEGSHVVGCFYDRGISEEELIIRFNRVMAACIQLKESYQQTIEINPVMIEWPHRIYEVTINQVPMASLHTIGMLEAFIFAYHAALNQTKMTFFTQ